jgi:hypothetical protein
MKALTFWKVVTVDQANLLERLIAMLDENTIRYCVIGGQAVNAYVEPLVSLDLDLVVAVDQIEQVETLFMQQFTVKRYPHSINISIADSDLRVQVQTDPRYASFVDRSDIKPVLGLHMYVASVQDVLQGKIWAALDADRRASKRQKDLADIARIIEAYPELKDKVPAEILSRLL